MRKPIEEEIADLERQISFHTVEIEKAKAAISALRRVDARANGTPTSLSPVKTRMKRGDLKARVIRLLQERGRDGLNATLASELAAARGEPLDRNSASSLLSRLKADGIVDHEGGMYRLAGTKGSADAERMH